ncbi:MAG TPA: DUF86 domain-containing protein [Thermoanaerobaculia bacterium]|nr:DUF86 domain-containing protein [Thermoanaerobaculia bacterium]
MAAQQILEFIGDQDFESFYDDAKTQSAVVLQILILGEASKRLSPGFRDRHPEIPWSDIMRMRDKLIHHYEGMDPGEIWQAAKEDVPALLIFLDRLIGAEE